ncbi:MAG: hypothetical protein AMJ55_09140 [Gammaproteobacteria bacterium SG8_15]|nr:MAG: hypothetical protein AMJ55_09140 [Gammaproteobacteria bacterium SG8_15]
MTAVVSERFYSLLQTDIEELKSLPEQSSCEITRDGMELTLSVWHDKPSATEHRVVVQAYKRQLMGIVGKVYAEGFVVNDQNQKRRLSSDELSEFI